LRFMMIPTYASSVRETNMRRWLQLSDGRQSAYNVFGVRQIFI